MTLDLQSDTRRPALAARERTAAPAMSLLPLLIAGPAIAVTTMVAALVATDAAGVPLRDPDHVAGNRLLLVVWMVLALVGLDILVRAGRRSSGWVPSWTALVAVRRERWTARRGIAVGSALLAFYATYLAYRNLKSVVPLLRPGDLFDHQLGDLDRVLFIGHDPAAVLHALWGVGLPTQAMSFVYMLFFLFIPATLAAALVFSPDLRSGLFYATAQSMNWVLGAASYFLLPSLGPIYDKPAEFSALPTTEATHLQSILLDQRLELPARSRRGDGAEHRGVRVAARLDLRHRRADRAHSRARAAGEDRGVDPGRPDRAVHDPPGLALLRGRHRRRRDRLPGARRRPPADALRPARSAADVLAEPIAAVMERSPATASPWRGVAAGAVVAAITVVAGLLTTGAVGLPLRDPDHVAALYLALVGFGVLVLVGIDILLRARAGSGGGWPSRAELLRVRRERWTAQRGIAVGGALVGFYVTYMAYRNLKASSRCCARATSSTGSWPIWTGRCSSGTTPPRCFTTCWGPA